MSRDTDEYPPSFGGHPVQRKLGGYQKMPWQYDSNYWSRDLVGVTMEQINVTHLPSKKRIENKFASVSLYGVCQKPDTHETGLDDTMMRKKLISDPVALEDELDLQIGVVNTSKNRKLKIHKVELTNYFSKTKKFWKDTRKIRVHKECSNEVEQLPSYPDSDEENK